LAPITTRRPEEDEEDFLEDEAEDEEEAVKPAAPAVSDRRRRRQMKRGEVVAEEEAAAPEPKGKDRPTPSQREVVKSRNVIVRGFQSIVEYFREVRIELGKVTWLSRQETLHMTYIVLIVTAISAAFLGLVSFLLGLVIQALAADSTRVLVGGITIVLIIVVSGAWLLRDRLFGTFD
jgi:preprotein translocase SecE subunit